MKATVFFLFLILLSFNSYAKNFIIHTHGDSFYYQNVDKNNVIILPNNEVVDVEKILELKDTEKPYITREGVEIYKMTEDNYYIDEEFESED